MKKFLFLFIATFLLFTLGCEKDEGNKVKLSEFVIGSWDSQELNLGDSPFGYFTVIIKTTNKYVLKFTLSEGNQSITCPEVGYIIDDSKNRITITEPDFEPNDGVTPDSKQTFDVTWTEGNPEMTWTPLNGSDAPTLVWTKQ